MKIIDAHVHVVQCISGMGSQGELRAIGKGQAIHASGQVIDMIPPDLGEYGVTPEKIIEVMDQNNVAKGVLLQGSYFGFQNNYTWEAMKKYPDRFVGAATYDPYCAQVDKVKSYLFDELGFKIIKFEVSNGSGLMSYHHPLALDGELMDEVFSHANERNLTFVIDIGRSGNPCWQIDALSRVVKKYSEMKFVICHLLSPQPPHEKVLIDGLTKLKYDNVWFDLAALPANQRPETYPYKTAQHYLKIGKEIVGADRLMFGSDIPSTLCRDTYGHLVDYAIKSQVFTDSELEKVFYDTAELVYF